MPLLTTQTTARVFKGTQEVSKIYRGDDLLWESYLSEVPIDLAPFYASGAVVLHHSATGADANPANSYTDLSGNSQYDGLAQGGPRPIEESASRMANQNTHFIQLNAPLPVRGKRLFYAFKPDALNRYDLLGWVQPDGEGDGTSGIRIEASGGGISLFRKNGGTWVYEHMPGLAQTMSGWNIIEVEMNGGFQTGRINDGVSSTPDALHSSYENFLVDRIGMGGIRRGMYGLSGDLIVVDMAKSDAAEACEMAERYLRDKFPIGT